MLPEDPGPIILNRYIIIIIIIIMIMIILIILILMIMIVTIHTYNRHLGLITPPPYLCFPPNDLCHYSCTIKMAKNRQTSGQDLINPAGDTSCAILGVILGIIHFLSKRDPPKSDQLYI